MGSRVMHYCISTILNEKLQINDNQFLLGGLAPDDLDENLADIKQWTELENVRIYSEFFKVHDDEFC